ncbi:Hypothetical predicted protein [Podarcis lilfordi]|uniref:Uncharacterized protein n=1 Tax=Podarcis lilfordi TaxID=74358 RepID=A0AA35KF97_9SAUR|nr:Hypothetical predicted protein [Podarcis lilfordi]
MSWKEVLVLALCKTSALLEQMHEKMDLMNEKMDLMTVVANNCGQLVNSDTEIIQGPTQEPVLIGQVQKTMEEAVVAPQIIQMERPKAPQEHKPLFLKIEVGVGQGESGAEEAFNFGETSKYARKYFLGYIDDCGEWDCGEWADLMKGDGDNFGLEPPRDLLLNEKGKKLRKRPTKDKEKCKYKQEEEDLQKGHGRDLRPSDIRLPG